MGDWKSLNDPVNIHPWTPLASDMANRAQAEVVEIEKREALQLKLMKACGKRGISEIPDAWVT